MFRPVQVASFEEIVEDLGRLPLDGGLDDVTGDGRAVLDHQLDDFVGLQKFDRVQKGSGTGEVVLVGIGAQAQQTGGQEGIAGPTSLHEEGGVRFRELIVDDGRRVFLQDLQGRQVRVREGGFDDGFAVELDAAVGGEEEVDDDGLPVGDGGGYHGTGGWRSRGGDWLTEEGVEGVIALSHSGDFEQSLQFLQVTGFACVQHGVLVLHWL